MLSHVTLTLKLLTEFKFDPTLLIVNLLIAQIKPYFHQSSISTSTTHKHK